MSKQLVKANGAALQPQPAPALTPEQIKILQQTVCAEHTPAQAQFFVEYCRAKGMDPFGKEIYSIVRKGRQTFQIGIDALRKRAEETGQYEGQTPYLWCGQDGKWVDVWLANAPPLAAKVGVYKSGWREPMWAIAKYAEYKPDEDWMWRKMPANQIAKCAEALALRRAFPSQLGGMYATEEMAQAGNGSTEAATQARAATLSERLGAPGPTPEAIAGPRIAPQGPVDPEQAMRDAEALAAKVIAQRGGTSVGGHDSPGGSAESRAAAPDSTVNMDSEPDPVEFFAALDAPPPVDAATISSARRTRLWAMARESGWSKPEVKKLLEARGYASSNDIRLSDYDAICSVIEGGADMTAERKRQKGR